jgi:hypothetical protein
LRQFHDDGGGMFAIKGEIALKIGVKPLFSAPLNFARVLPEHNKNNGKGGWHVPRSNGGK